MLAACTYRLTLPVSANWGNRGLTQVLVLSDTAHVSKFVKFEEWQGADTTHVIKFEENGRGLTLPVSASLYRVLIFWTFMFNDS